MKNGQALLSLLAAGALVCSGLVLSACSPEDAIESQIVSSTHARIIVSERPQEEEIRDVEFIVPESLKTNEPTASPSSSVLYAVGIIEGEEYSPEPAPIKEEHKYYYMDKSYGAYPCPTQYQDYLWELCKKYDIEDQYKLCLAIMWRESNFEPDTVSSTNDYGLMQINANTFDYITSQTGITDFLDPYNNIDAGLWELSRYFHKYDDVHQVLMSYNMGEAGAKRSGKTSTSYSEGVLKDMEDLKELIVLDEHK